MKHAQWPVIAMFLLCGLISQVQPGYAQQIISTNTNVVVPPLVNFSGVLTDLNGKPLTGVVGVTFLLYKDSQGGSPLWMETQNVEPDRAGHYTVMLGSTTSTGLPADIFAAGEAHWLGVQVQGQQLDEQPRVLLVSAPYALKAGDAQTLGGLPASAFVLAAPAAVGSSATNNTTETVSPLAAEGVTTTGGTANYLPIFSGADTIIDSAVFQTGSGTTAKIGIDTATPATQLDVNGAGSIRGTLTLPATGTATATAGDVSQGLNFVASSYDSTSATAVNQTFRWHAEPAANDSASPSGTLNLLYGLGTAAPGETGLKISSDGIFTFATGQTFPTVTGNETVTGNVSSDGSVNATTGFDLAGTPFVFGSVTGHNALLGFAGNFTSTGTYNTASGFQALLANTTGYMNTAIGASALNSNTTGAYNVAVGHSALSASTSAFANTGVGNAAGSTIDLSALTGKNNTALGTGASFSTGSLTNASAIGANAVVGESNALVLGGISGVRGQTASVNVGIGTTTPKSALDVIAYSVASGSALSGTDGVISTGGNGDPKGATDGTYGGNGINATGGTGKFVSNGELNIGGGDGVGGVFTGGNSGNPDALGQTMGTGDGIDVFPGSGQAAVFEGSVSIFGDFSATAKEFKIDHPLDPANKYLVHASVESSEMMNIYTGNITTDSQGQAMVQLPEWFEALNTDFRYQLTVIGQFAQAIVAHEIENNRFEIRTNAPNVKVSWQVTGVRQDSYAKAHPLVVEQQKDARLRGFYIHPDLFGAPAERQIEWARHPQMMKQIQETQARQLTATQKHAVPRN
jgi:trimeric autotransporter adhesin